MPATPEPERNIEERTDYEIYAAIRYLEATPTVASKQSAGAAATEQCDDHGAVISVCSYIGVLDGLVALRLYLR